MGSFRAALVQTTNVYKLPYSVQDLESISPYLHEIRERNIKHNLDLISLAKEYEASIVCLGELFAWPYFPLSLSLAWLDAAEDPDSGPTITCMAEAARKNHMIIIAPIYEFDASTNQRFDTAIVLDENGNNIGKYRKCHIPYGENEMASFFEKSYVAHSNGILTNDSENNISHLSYFPVLKTSCGNIGVSICYDRHFEGVVNALASQGAEIIFCPSATFGAHSRRLWDMEFQVDSSRHQVFIGGNNRFGIEHPWEVEFFGESHFAGPAGKLENLSTHPNLVISEIDLDVIKQEHPAGWHIQSDRRAEVFI